MPIPFIIVPERYEARVPKAGYNERYDQLICEKCGYPPEPVQNTRFLSDPSWRANLGTWSIQAAANREGVWEYVYYLYYAAAIAPYVVRLL